MLHENEHATPEQETRRNEDAQQEPQQENAATVENWGIVVNNAMNAYQGSDPAGTIDALKHIERTLGAERLEKMTFDDRVALIALVKYHGARCTTAEMMEKQIEYQNYMLFDSCFTLAEAAEKYLELTDYFCGLPKEWEFMIDYFDYEQWAYSWNIETANEYVYYNDGENGNDGEIFAGYVHLID